jgi:hypothetical protein
MEEEGQGKQIEKKSMMWTVFQCSTQKPKDQNSEDNMLALFFLKLISFTRYYSPYHLDERCSPF